MPVIDPLIPPPRNRGLPPVSATNSDDYRPPLTINVDARMAAVAKLQGEREQPVTLPGYDYAAHGAHAL